MHETLRKEMCRSKVCRTGLLVVIEVVRHQKWLPSHPPLCLAPSLRAVPRPDDAIADEAVKNPRQKKRHKLKKMGEARRMGEDGDEP